MQSPKLVPLELTDDADYGPAAARTARNVEAWTTETSSATSCPAPKGLSPPSVTAEFELDESGAVARLVVQPLGIFRPKKGDGT